MSLKKTLLCLALAAVLLASCSPRPTPNTIAATQDLNASLSDIQGTVEIKNPGQSDFSPAANGGRLEVLGQVRTGADGRLRLDLSTGSIIRVAPDSSFTLTESTPQNNSLLTRLKLEAGKLWVVLNGGSIDVETPSGLASVRGSYLLVWIDSQTQNVYVDCFEGECAAGNDSGSLDLYTGSGALLYHVESGGTPPPPDLHQITWQEYQEWIDSVPEAAQVKDSILATLTAQPTLTPTETPTPTPTTTPAATFVPACFQLTSPADGASLPDIGPFTFSWTAQPGAASYAVEIISPLGGRDSYPVNTISLPFYAEALAGGGNYSWQVSARDANGKVLCTTSSFSFTKPVTVLPAPTSLPIPIDISTPSPVPSNATITLISGPDGIAINTVGACSNDFIVDVSDPEGIAEVKVSYVVLDNTGNVAAQDAFLLGPANGEYGGYNMIITPGTLMPYTVQWRIVVVDAYGDLTYGPIYTFTENIICLPLYGRLRRP